MKLGPDQCVGLNKCPFTTSDQDRSGEERALRSLSSPIWFSPSQEQPWISSPHLFQDSGRLRLLRQGILFEVILRIKGQIGSCFTLAEVPNLSPADLAIVILREFSMFPIGNAHCVPPFLIFLLNSTKNIPRSRSRLQME